MLEFEFMGGAFKTVQHTSVKFLLFHVVGGSEVSTWEMQKDHLVVEKEATAMDWVDNKGGGFNPIFTTGNGILKIFISRQGFGIQKQFHSFYLKLREGNYPLIKIVPFGNETPYYLKGKFSFLTKDEIKKILDKDHPSFPFMLRQKPLPKYLLKQIVTVVERPQNKPIPNDVRKVRLKPKQRSKL